MGTTTEPQSGHRPWTREDVTATLVSIAVQIVVWLAVALVGGSVWSRLDGAGLFGRWGDACAVAGVICLFGSGTFASKVSVVEYMQWGIRGRNETLFGDDIGTHDLGILTPLGEAIATALVLFSLAIVLS